MLLEDTPLPLILGPPFVLASLLFAITLWRRDPRATEAAKAVAMLQQVTVAMGAIVVVLYFLLPSTSSLSTFGLPTTPDDIGPPERLLAYLQAYNKALTRTIDVVHGFLFVFVWWFLAATHTASKAFTALKRDQSQRSEKA
jgi:hypothetical protein